MSAIAGILEFDSKPVERLRYAHATRTHLETITKPAAPGDAIGYWQQGNIGLGCAFTLLTPVAVEEQQPLYDAVSECAIAFDGRLDNREQLRTSLANYVRLLDKHSDAAYTLAAYLEWGDRVAEHLLGDFAFAIWNARTQELLLVRDRLGIKPLYYSTYGQRITFASTLKQMLNDPIIPKDLNEAIVVRFLYGDTSTRGTQTYYQHIQGIPGSHYLVVKNQQICLTRYWDLPSHPPEHCRGGFGEYREEFRALFADAVQCRLRSSTPVGLMLSGGLDSGAVACMAGYLHEQTGAAQIDAYSTIYDQFTSCDERKYSTAAADRYGFKHTCLLADDCWSLAQPEQWLPVFATPFFAPFDGAIYKVLARAKADGIRTMLMGDGGDLLLTGSPNYLASWLLQGRWGDLDRQIRAQSHTMQQRYIRRLAISTIFPLIPVWMQRAIESRRFFTGKEWMPANLRQQYNIDIMPTCYSGQNALWYQLRNQLSQVGQSPGARHVDRMMRSFGLEERQPFLDTRLFEFILRISPEAFYRDGMTKMLLRESLHDILPPIIRDAEAAARLRTDKGNLGPLMNFGLSQRKAFVEELLNDSELERRGYVQPKAWKHSIQSNMKSDRTLFWSHWRSLTLEMWLRVQTGRLPNLEFQESKF